MKSTLPLLCLLSLLAFSCTDPGKLAELENMKQTLDSLTSVIDQQAAAQQSIIPFMTFQKENAEQAMNFYIGLFEHSEIVSLTRWGEGAPSKEGTIMQASFRLNGTLFMCSDSPPVHDWDFTPALSNYMECESEEELTRLFTSLSENGEVTMPLDNYGFSQQFGWVIDQFGISWQLNLP
ncbi:MAG: VOC family protein [Bacteroidota bacterium]